MYDMFCVIWFISQKMWYDLCDMICCEMCDVISDRGSGSEKGVLPDSKKSSDQGLKLESGCVKIKYERV